MQLSSFLPQIVIMFPDPWKTLSITPVVCTSVTKCSQRLRHTLQTRTRAETLTSGSPQPPQVSCASPETCPLHGAWSHRQEMSGTSALGLSHRLILHPPKPARLILLPLFHEQNTEILELIHTANSGFKLRSPFDGLCPFYQFSAHLRGRWPRSKDGLNWQSSPSNPFVTTTQKHLAYTGNQVPSQDLGEPTASPLIRGAGLTPTTSPYLIWSMKCVFYENWN